MIDRLRHRFLTVRHDYPNPLDHQRARGLLAAVWLASLALLLWFIGMATNVIIISSSIVDYVTTVLFAGLVIAIYYSIQNGKMIWANRLFVLALIMALFPFSVSAVGIATLTIPLVGAGLFLNRRGFLAVIVILAAILLFVNFTNTSQVVSSTDLSTILLTLGVSASFILVFGSNTNQFIEQSYLDADKLKIIKDFSSAVREVNDENNIFARVINLLTARMDYTFAQVYLADREGNLIRLIRTGLGVDQANVTGDVTLSSNNAISRAARTRELVLVSANDNKDRREHLMPSTLNGVAISLTSGDALIGVLDVQSNDERPFTENQLMLLTLMANQVATVIAHLRDSARQQRNIQEQREVSENLRTRLVELRKRTHTEIGATWGDYLEQRGIETVGFDMLADNQQFTPASDLPENLLSALQSGQVVVEQQDNVQVVSIPIMLRGEALGAMSFTVNKKQSISDRQLDIAQNIADRLAQALETRRLFEQTQEQAQRERKANEAASLLLSSTDISTVLNLAADSFNQALGAIHTRIYLQPGKLSQHPDPVQSEEEAG